MPVNPHVPGNEIESGSFHYRRDERMDLPNSPINRKKRSNLRFVILFIDLLLIAGVAMCLRNSGEYNIFESSKTGNAEALRVQHYEAPMLYTLSVNHMENNKVELRFVVQLSNKALLNYIPESKVVFFIESPLERRMLKAEEPALKDPSPAFVYHAETSNYTNATLSAAYYTGPDEEPAFTLVLPVE